MDPVERLGHVCQRTRWRDSGAARLGGQDIWLLSCSTGCPTGTFAQGLANELGVVVRAPTTDIFVSSRGRISFESGGGWRIFSPGG
jgi:hypothetical protein